MPSHYRLKSRRTSRSNKRSRKTSKSHGKRKLSSYNKFMSKHLKPAMRGAKSRSARNKAFKKVAKMWSKAH